MIRQQKSDLMVNGSPKFRWICVFLAVVGLFSFPVAALVDIGVRIADGDTIEIGGTTFRQNGIDAPEYGQRCGKWKCGEAATDELERLIHGRTVACDPISQDGYGRTIATCHADCTDIGALLVERGFVWAFLKYSQGHCQLVLDSRQDWRCKSILRGQLVSIFCPNLEGIA